MVELEPKETDDQAVARFSAKYGTFKDPRGELAAIVFFDKVVLQLGDLTFTSDALNHRVVKFDPSVKKFE